MRYFAPSVHDPQKRAGLSIITCPQAYAALLRPIVKRSHDNPKLGCFILRRGPRSFGPRNQED